MAGDGQDGLDAELGEEEAADVAQDRGQAGVVLDELLDKRGIGTPSVLNGEEQKWPDWHFVFMSWASMLSTTLANEMREARVGRPTILARLPPDTQERNVQLFHILAMLVQGGALRVLRRVGESGQLHGYEAYRQL